MKIPINVIFSDRGVAKTLLSKTPSKGRFFDGVCYDVLSVRMLELIFVACFCSFFCFFLDYVFFEGNEGKSSL